MKGFQLETGPHCFPPVNRVWLRGKLVMGIAVGTAVAAGALVGAGAAVGGTLVGAGAMVAGAAVGVAAGAQAVSTMPKAMTTDKTGSSLRIFVLLF
jgi:hypothetical protein